jgi:DNA-binding GntR family transcriptional regulator
MQRKSTRQPRYRAIAEKLQADISEGRYPVGSLLPPELKLCKKFRASRHTMREALRVITEQGLISRRAGAGSVVTAATQPTVFTHTVGSLAQWMRYPADTYRDTISADEVVADRKLAQTIHCEPGTKWFRILSVRRSDHLPEPLAWTEIYVLPKFASVVRQKDHPRTNVHQQVEKMFGETVERAHLEVFATRISPKLAKVLKVRPGTAALTMVRRYWGRKSGHFETTVVTHPEGRYTYSLELTRQLKSLR